jgi:hypothetical protein
MSKLERRPGVTYSRVDLSHYHLYAAFLFAFHAEGLENKASPMASSDTLYRYRSFVMGAILSAVASLEARIAELQIDAEDGPLGHSVTGLTNAQCMALVTALTALPPRTPMLDRYQEALRTIGKNPFKADTKPYRSVSLLVKLRNYLVHFPAEWLAIADEESGPLPQKELPRIERQLKRQFPSTKFANPSKPFFPDHCLSAGCARWAAVSSLAFAQQFSTRAGVVMKHFRPVIREA